MIARHRPRRAGPSASGRRLPSVPLGAGAGRSRSSASRSPRSGSSSRSSRRCSRRTNPLAHERRPAHAAVRHHLFGTDELGRDVLSRVHLRRRHLAAARDRCSSGSSLLIGGTLGAVAGYFGGLVDGMIMRATDLVFAFPAIILAMVVDAALGPSLLTRCSRS